MHSFISEISKKISDYGAYKDYFGPFQEVYGFQ